MSQRVNDIKNQRLNCLILLEKHWRFTRRLNITEYLLRIPAEKFQAILLHCTVNTPL